MKAKTVLIVAAVVALFGIVGHFDYEDAKQEEISYCENVKAGLWPDYEGNYAKVCEAEYGKPKKFTNSSIRPLDNRKEWRRIQTVATTKRH